jgi:hypothetical protein
MSEIPAGAMRFNSDSQKLEYWNGSAWFQVHTATPNLARGAEPTPGPRGIIAGGRVSAPAFSDLIEYVNISSMGNAVDFNANLANAGGRGASVASSTRGVFIGGQSPSPLTFNNDVQYITFAHTGLRFDWGTNLTNGAIPAHTGHSNGTRGVFTLGQTGPAVSDFSNRIEYLEIATSGSAIPDFGDLSSARANPNGAAGSRVRGLYVGGRTDASTRSNVIDMITMSTLGNAQDFGDLTGARSLGTAGSNATRAVIAGGYENPGADARVDNIDYVTIASTGNAINFGDQTLARTDASAMPSSTRCVFGSGDPSTNRIDYIHFATTGNAIDFGDCTARDESFSGMSNGHGGL